MSHHWPEDTEYRQIVLVPEDRECPRCDRDMSICDHPDERRAKFHALKRRFRRAPTRSASTWPQ
jgi:hypothetical protein